jgi:hypothetical protein
VVYFVEKLLLLLLYFGNIPEYKAIGLQKMNCILVVFSERKSAESAVFSLFNTISRLRQHPRQGRLRYEQIALTPSGAPDFKLVMLPAVKI